MQPEVQVNAANWDASALQQPEGGENEDNEEAADDEVWKQFQTMDEQKRKQVCVCVCVCVLARAPLCVCVRFLFAMVWLMSTSEHSSAVAHVLRVSLSRAVC